jgi:hypothetical protein
MRPWVIELALPVLRLGIGDLRLQDQLEAGHRWLRGLVAEVAREAHAGAASRS